MITLKNLGKIYIGDGIRVEALSAVDMELPQVGMVFLLGKSGSGKSTLLNILGGLDSPTSGEIIVDGKNLGKEVSLDNYRNTDVSFVFQEFHLNKALNVEQNVLITERLAGRDANTDKSALALASVGLEAKAKNKIHELSGGEKQRVAIARALIKTPKIILADEPTGKLDETNGIIIFDLLKKLSKTSLVIVVSHDRESAETYGDRIIRISDGKIVSDILQANFNLQKNNENVENQKTVDFKSIEKQENIELKIEKTAYESNAINIKTSDLNVKQEISNGKVKSNNTIKLSLKNACYLAYKNVISRPFKTLGSIVICSMLFAILGLSAILFAFSRQGALEQTYKKHFNGSIVISNGYYSDYGAAWYLYGDKISDDDAKYFKQNYDGYMEVKRLSNFTLPDFFGGSSFDAFASFNGVYEIKEKDLNELDFKLMNFENAENVFLIDNIRKVLEAMPLPDALKNSLNTNYPEGTQIPPSFLYMIAYLLFNDAADTLNNAAHLPLPHYGNSDAVTEADRNRILSFPEFSNIPKIDEAVFPEDFWDKFFEYYQNVNFESALPLTGNAKSIKNTAVGNENYEYHEIAVTDFTIFVLYKRIVELFSPYCALPLPEEKEELLQFLNNSGYESSVVLLYNALTAFSGSSRFRITGVLDTGYKQKYETQIYELSSAVFNGNFRRMNDKQLELYDDLNNYYLMIYTGEGFASSFEDEVVRLAVRINITESQIADLFQYIEQKNKENDNIYSGLRYNSIYGNVTWWISHSVDEMRSLFIPIGILMIIVSTVGLSFFLSTAVTKKRKDIGVFKAMGGNTQGVVLIYILESLVTIISTVIFSTLIAYLLYSIVNKVFVASNDYLLDEVVVKISILYLTPLSLIFTAVTAFVTGLISTIHPARKIARLSPVDAIQSE